MRLSNYQEQLTNVRPCQRNVMSYPVNTLGDEREKKRRELLSFFSRLPHQHPCSFGVPILKSLGIWVSPVTLTLTQIAKVIWEGDANITRVLGMEMPKTGGCPYHCFTGLKIASLGRVAHAYLMWCENHASENALGWAIQWMQYELHSGTKLIPEWKPFRYHIICP